MSDHSSNAPTSADRAELEQTLACVEQMIRDFENMTAQARMANAEMTVQVEQLGSQGNGRATTLVVITSSPDFQELAKSLARQKVLQQELVNAAAAYSQELSRWAEDLERKEQSTTIVTGANGVLPGETFSSPPAFEDSETVLGAIAGTGADMVADTLIAFGNMAGPAKAPYNPVDAAFGYQDAFWKMLGYKSRPIGAQNPAENAQLDDALESALFSLYGQGAFVSDSPKVDARGQYTEDTIKWGVIKLPVRPSGRGFWAPRIPQADPAVDAYELQINPNNESYYLPRPGGGYIQFENFTNDTLQDGKLIKSNRSLYHVDRLPEFASEKMLKTATGQLQAAKPYNLKIQWLVSDRDAAEQLKSLFQQNKINVTVTQLQPRHP